MIAEPSKPTLAEFAWKQAGPLEFVITFAINFLIAVGVYWPLDRVPLVSPYSMMNMVVPMCFMLPFGSSFFGVANAARCRSQGLVDSSWPIDAPWKPYAIRLGFMRGIVGAIGAFVVLWILCISTGNPSLSKWFAVFLIGLVSGILGYLCHSTAIISTRDQFPVAATLSTERE